MKDSVRTAMKCFPTFFSGPLASLHLDFMIRESTSKPSILKIGSRDRTCSFPFSKINNNNTFSGECITLRCYEEDEKEDEDKGGKGQKEPWP